MGYVSWFLRQRYKRYTDSNGKFSCHIFQLAFMEQIFECYKIEHCKRVRTPYQSR